MKRQKDLLLLLISGFILTVIWIVATVKHNIDTSTISDALRVEVTSIVPKFDTKTLDVIKSKTNVDPRFEVQTPLASPSAATPTPTKIPSITVTPTGTASKSAR